MVLVLTPESNYLGLPKGRFTEYRQEVTHLGQKKLILINHSL